jgi:hypothetical protein
MEISKVRDLTLVEISDEKVLVIACDSCGSIGLKEKDVFKVPPYFTGRFTARVTMLEVMSTGAEIITLTNSVCSEMKPTGEEIIRGIKDELQDAGIPEIVLTGSTEENFPTYSTGLGVTAIGIANPKTIKVNKARQAGDGAVVVIGLPKVGSEIDLEKDEEIVKYEQLKRLLEDPCVYEIVPCGSKGIQYEAETLAKENGMKFRLCENIDIDIKKSCGPATTVIAAVNSAIVSRLLEQFKNCNFIGYLY